MKKVLGLDLGVTSIGWALVDEEENKILGMGSRIIPLSTDDKEEFSKGNAISKNQKRTQKRTQRRRYDRYKLRRQNLIDLLKNNDMMPDNSLKDLNKLELWKLRSDAVTNKITLKELGRILLHLNQKRGYKSPRSEANLDKQETEYVSQIKSRYEKLQESNLTIGQKFYEELKRNNQFRIKDNIFPREAYVEEFNTILKNQQKYYPETLSDNFIQICRDEIIYYQRKLKSQKGLVSICELEGFWNKVKETESEKEIFVGPRVAPKSSPLFQVCKIWEIINNIELKDKVGKRVEITIEKKHEIFDYMDNNEKLTYMKLLKILGLKKQDVYGNKQLINGLQGNITKAAIQNCFDNPVEYRNLMEFDLEISGSEEKVFKVDRKSGEVIGEKKKKVISPNIEEEPLYKLWHVIYSISDKEICKNTLMYKFSLPENIATKMADIDFRRYGFGNKSHRAMRKILPYLLEGDCYSDACSYAGYNHSMFLTKDENYKRKLLDKLVLLPKNSLRQPVVEKILNQTINVVNAIIDKYGKPEEIRVELARELKQSKEERNRTFRNITQRERENKIIEKELAEFGLRATRNNIIKWRLYHEISNNEKRQNGICIYCGQPITITSALLGEEIDIEHIIPKTKLFDDSQNNKTLSHRKCNADKKDQTAFDFMNSKPEKEFKEYIERVNNLYHKKLITKTKRDKLLTSSKQIPDDFIERQLRQTQYITRKAREILLGICRNVWTTSGSVTSELRYLWGWEDVLMNLQLPKYRELGMTEIINVGNNGKRKEIIPGWSKRDDHRHHAIDALTIACTKQEYIQRLNTLNTQRTRKTILEQIRQTEYEYDKNKSLLENYLISEKPFTTKKVEQAAANILISIKPGKKVATKGKRVVKKKGKKVVVQKDIIVPRGPLSEEMVYGKIKLIEQHKSIKYLFNHPDLIFKPYIKKLVKERLAMHNNDNKKALASLKKEPIYLDKDRKIVLEYGTCYKEEVVIKKPVADLSEKQVDDVVDPIVKKKLQERVEKYGGKVTDAFKNLDEEPIWLNEEKKIPIKTVRCKTGLSAIEPILKNEDGENVGFVKPGNNHHLALYEDEFGNKQFSICTFWHAVERKKYNFPVIIKDPAKVTDMILETEEDTYPESFLEKLPGSQWKFIESFQQNELFTLGIDKQTIEEAMSGNNYPLISKYLYRVQKLSLNEKQQVYLVFRHHIETTIDDSKDAMSAKRFYRVQSLGALEQLHPHKIRINCLGDIVH